MQNHKLRNLISIQFLSYRSHICYICYDMCKVLLTTAKGSGEPYKKLNFVCSFKLFFTLNNATT